MSSSDFVRLGQRIRSFLFDRDAAAGDGTITTVGNPAELHDPALFAGHLKEMAQELGHLALGRLQILGFQAVQEQLGDQWPQMAHRISEVIETTFRRRLRPEDMFRRYDDLVYLIIFSGLSLDEARLKAHFIAEEVWQQLFGLGEAEDKLDVSLLTIDLEAGRVEDVSDLDTLLMRQFASAQAAAQEAARIEDDDSLPWLPSSSSGPAEAPTKRNDTPRTPARAPAPEPPRPTGHFSITYTPMWTVRRNAVSSYYARMRLVQGPRDVLYGHSILRRSTDPRDVYEFDLATLARAQAAAEQLARRNSPAVIACPVHYTTLMNREARQEFLSLCAALPRAVGRHVFLEVCELAEGFPRHTAFELCQWLKPFCRSVWAQIPPVPAAIESMKEAGFSAVGFDARHVSPGRFALVAGLFTATARKARLYSYVHGISTSAAARTAAAAGFDLISGDAIQRPLEKVLPPYRLTEEDIVAPVKA